MKPLALRLAIGALCVAATQVPVWQVKTRSGVLASAGANFDVNAVPLQIGQWSGTQTELDEELFTYIGAISMTNRQYRSELGRIAWVHLASFTPADQRLSHSPNVCYSSAGWTIVKDDWRPSAEDRRYRLMRAENAGQAVAVVYWYQLGPDVAAEHEDLRKIMQKLRAEKKPWPPIVKVLMQVSIEFSEDDAKTVADELGAGIYNSIKDNS